MGVAFQDAEGVTTGPLFGLVVGKTVRDRWVLEGQFRAWIGGSSDAPGRDPDYENEQWMVMLRVLYVHGSTKLRPFVGIGGGWDRMTQSRSVTGGRDAGFAQLGAGLEGTWGSVAVRPEFGLQVGPAIVAPQLTQTATWLFR